MRAGQRPALIYFVFVTDSAFLLHAGKLNCPFFRVTPE